MDDSKADVPPIEQKELFNDAVHAKSLWLETRRPLFKAAKHFLCVSALEPEAPELRFEISNELAELLTKDPEKLQITLAEALVDSSPKDLNALLQTFPSLFIDDYEQYLEFKLFIISLDLEKPAESSEPPPWQPIVETLEQLLVKLVEGAGALERCEEFLLGASAYLSLEGSSTPRSPRSPASPELEATLDVDPMSSLMITQDVKAYLPIFLGKEKQLLERLRPQTNSPKP